MHRIIWIIFYSWCMSILSIISFNLIIILINIFRESICCNGSPFTICHLPISIDSLRTRKLKSLATTIVLLSYMIDVNSFIIFIAHSIIEVTIYCLFCPITRHFDICIKVYLIIWNIIANIYLRIIYLIIYRLIIIKFRSIKESLPIIKIR